MHQRVLDSIVFFLVGLWVGLSAPRELRRLARLQARHEVFRVRIAVPVLANEKYLWRKLFDHNPLFVTLTDKQACKGWVASLGLDIRQPKTLWVGTDANYIPADVWAVPMIIKATHGCQMSIPVRQEPADKAPLIAQANAFLLRDHGSRRREWAYGGVPRRLIAEEWVFPGTDLIEYKCYAFGPKVVQVAAIYRAAPESAAIWQLNEDGQFVLTDQVSAVAPIINPAPLGKAGEAAIALSSELGKPFDHMRFDWLSDGSDLMLGEVTVYNLAGRAHLQGHYREAVLNKDWDLRRSWFLTTPQTEWRKIYAAALNRRLNEMQFAS
ncbi:ATP-grasp fold amidoligase family protein [Loktanella sp. 5RATIMAR09]|uniref:ATP-grasp fold amidoligase family protein n=1 Tax=Loktanella sp. 5RATIMAR09 TaxID=1225655 RepID=UPI0006EBAD2A|nr:ATP-grasp fold amidoligase family protein [Loktanella sp. 5RATIMAR09]